jgi:hypothetical protein
MLSLSRADVEALAEAGASRPEVIWQKGGDRRILAVATDEVTRVIGTWYDGESARDIKWQYDDPLTLSEAADIYPLAYPTLAQAAREGRIEAEQHGSVWLTTRSAIEKAIEKGNLRPRDKKG